MMIATVRTLTIVTRVSTSIAFLYQERKARPQIPNHFTMGSGNLAEVLKLVEILLDEYLAHVAMAGSSLQCSANWSFWRGRLLPTALRMLYMGPHVGHHNRAGCAP